MDKLLLTNSQEAFDTSTFAKKVLFRFHLPSVIASSSFLKESETAQFNDDFFIRFLKDGDRILRKIDSLSSRLNSIKVPLQNVPTNEWIKGLSHSLLEEQIERSFLIQDLVEFFGTNYTCELILDQPPLDYNNGETPPSRNRQHIKNKLYILFDLKRFFSPKKQFDFVYLLTNAPHHFELLHRTLENHMAADERVAVVIYPTKMGDTGKSIAHLPKGVNVFAIQEFRGSPRFSIDKSVWDHHKFLDFASIEANYTMMLNMLASISPKVCLTMGYQNHTRFLSHCCSHFNIPVVSVDYSLITDDYRFERGIKYDHRVTISEAQINLWKKRNDPSTNHHAIGFLKYDEIQTLKFDKDTFEQKAEFEFKKTLMFASSYGFDSQVKHDLIKFLSDHCYEKEYNLLIKKHPLETDQIPDSVLAGNGHSSQMVFKHEEITSLEAISYSDVVLSQGSSIVLDALYFSKPFITYSLGKNSITDLMAFGEEEFLLTASGFHDLAKAIEKGMSEDSNELMNAIQRKRAYYLGNLEGESSICLHNILKEIKAGK